jgi:hypothetical protein
MINNRVDTLHPHVTVLDWYRLQQQMIGFTEILPDQDVINVLTDKKWNLDLSHAHANLKNKLTPYSVPKTKTDFFVITDIEISKFPLEMIFKIIKSKFESSTHGGYIAFLSYYLTSKTRYHELTGTYVENIDTVFRQNLQFVSRIENKSTVIHDPIDKVHNGALLEGSNFLFVHPNIRYWLWK